MLVSLYVPSQTMIILSSLHCLIIPLTETHPNLQNRGAWFKKPSSLCFHWRKPAGKVSFQNKQMRKWLLPLWKARFLKYLNYSKPVLLCVYRWLATWGINLVKMVSARSLCYYFLLLWFWLLLPPYYRWINWISELWNSKRKVTE